MRASIAILQIFSPAHLLCCNPAHLQSGGGTLPSCISAHLHLCMSADEQNIVQEDCAHLHNIICAILQFCHAEVPQRPGRLKAASRRSHKGASEGGGGSGFVRSCAEWGGELSFRNLQLALRCFEDPKDGGGATEGVQSAAIRRNILPIEGSDAQETPDLVEGTTEPPRRDDALEASHGTVSVLDPAMVLFKLVVQVDVRSMPDRLAEFAADGRWIRVVTVARDPIWRYTGDGPRRSKEGLSGREVAVLAQHHIHQRHRDRWRDRDTAIRREP